MRRGEVLRPEDDRIQTLVGAGYFPDVHDALRRFNSDQNADSPDGQAVGQLVGFDLGADPLNVL